jgi:hypothetical protein
MKTYHSWCRLCCGYRPGKPSSQLSTGVDFSPLLLGYCGREAGYGLADRMAVVLWIVSGALLLRCSGSVQICWQLYERLLYVDHVRYVWSWTIRGLSVESVWRVGWVSPAGCTSIWIAATLRCEYPLICGSLVANLMACLIVNLESWCLLQLIVCIPCLISN